jgi:PAS domain S-box-containing protein
MYPTRFQFGLTLLAGLFLLATLFVVVLYGFTPTTPAARAPIFLASLTAILIGGLICILLVLRWLLRPYRQLVGEAERASVAAKTPKSKDEAAFVLETFQSVVAQLQAQRQELERLSAQASERADSAEKFSERILASVPSGLIAFDANGHSMALNLPGRELLGVDGKGLGQHYRELLENYSHLAEMVEQCLQTGMLYRREEVESTTSGGQVRRLGATVAPIDLSSERGSRGALCLLTDITEVTQLREQVALKKNLESLGEMSAGLAHEFKNAIAALHGYVQLLQGLELDERGRGTADSLLNEVRNLSEMVTSFLNFARPQPLELERISLAELIDDCVAELEPVFIESKVELDTNCNKGSAHSEPLEIRADERMLRQALLNLLRNAAEAIPDEQTERKVSIHAFRQQLTSGASSCIVEISDTGEGIPPVELQKIFIPFFTTKSKGHGIGLALAHRVVTEHGGTLSAANSAIGGAVFTIKLPD